MLPRDVRDLGHETLCEPSRVQSQRQELRILDIEIVLIRLSPRIVDELEGDAGDRRDPFRQID
jgi:hypothetical protein